MTKPFAYIETLNIGKLKIIEWAEILIDFNRNKSLVQALIYCLC